MAEVTPTKFLHVCTLIPYLQDYPLYKNLAAKFPTILDSFLLVLTVLGEFQHGWVAEARWRARRWF